MSTAAVAKSGLALALGAGVGIAMVHVSDGDLARTYGWLQPITSFSKGTSSISTIRCAPSLTANEMVTKFRDDGLPIAVIAEIIGVERKTVYAWLSGGAVRQHNQNRLEQLYAVLTNGKTADFRHLYRFWNRSVSNGFAIGELLKKPELDLTAIENTLAELWPLADKQQRLAQTVVPSSNFKTNPFVRESREAGLSYDA